MGLDGSKSVLRIKRLVSDFNHCPLVDPGIILTISGLFLSLILHAVRSTVTGERKSYGTLPLYEHMFADVRHWKKKQRLQTP